LLAESWLPRFAQPRMDGYLNAKTISLAALPHKAKGPFHCISTAENKLNFAAPTAKEICATKT